MSRPPIRHLIWDWNGTLLDDVAACVAALNVLLHRKQLPRIRLPRYRAVFGFPVRHYYETLGFQLTPDEWRQTAAEYHRLYLQTASTAPLRPGVRATLHRLANLNIPSAVLSASEIGILRVMIAARQLEGQFAQVAGLPNRFAHSKLDAGRALLKKIPVPPEEILLIGDTDHDYEVARALRCRCVLLTGGHQSAVRLRACGCPVIPDVRRLPAILGAPRA
jgi:phosphoglycolate phosphatase